MAAVGYPIAGGTVLVKCAGGSALPVSTTSAGAWHVNLSGVTLPCAIEVSGGTVNGVTNTTPYHSIASSPDNANVTPLTDLTLANLAGTATPGAWFSGLTGDAVSTITTDSVNTALFKLDSALSGLPPLSKINPITTPFTAVAGDPGDDMLAAVQTAMTDTGVSYSALLGCASTGFSTAAVTNLNAALPAAYAGTVSGGSTLIITGVTPAQGAAGTVVTIAGANFSATAANDTINFNGVPAVITSATASQLVATVPATASSGAISVTVGSQTANSPAAFTVASSSATAAQYFTRTAVGNTWSWLWTTTGQPSTQPYTSTTTVIASGSGLVTYSDTSSYANGSRTRTDQIDSTGTWISTDSSGVITTVLPAVFSIGTTYAPNGAQSATIAAFNVTRTVPAGTFDDCLQIEVIDTTTAQDITYYLSPTAGTAVEVTVSSSGTTFADQLQAGYVAN